MKTVLRNAAIIAGAAIYLAGATVTFGMVWNRIECDHDLLSMCEEARVVKSTGAAMFWPFALSAIYFDEASR